MKIAILQLNPELGEVEKNIRRVDEILAASWPQNGLDLLVLPELALTGYNHTKESLKPLLEPADDGRSAAWAKSTAKRLNCIVSLGFPEIVEPPSSNGLTAVPSAEGAKAYNSTLTVDASGQILAHYRKTHLYYTDESWATEGPDKWLIKGLPLSLAPTHPTATQLPDTTATIKAAFGICMDLNPYKFLAPWTAYEFATAARQAGAQMLVLSMAWLSSLPSELLRAEPLTPDLDTFSYWLNRLVPLLEAEGEGVVVVCANLCGDEPGANPSGQAEEGVRYAGTSWVGKIGNGKVEVWGMMGRRQEGLLVVDTEMEPGTTFRLHVRGDDEDQNRR